MNATKTLPLCEACNNPKADHEYVGGGTRLCPPYRDPESSRRHNRESKQITLHAPNDPRTILPPTHPKHESTISAAIRDLQDLAAGMYDIPGGVDELFTIAHKLKTLAAEIDHGPLITGIRVETEENGSHSGS